jgi:hypothetical protein
METWQIAAIVWLVLFAPLGKYVAKEKGRPRLKGIFMGALFGPLGCLIEACLPNGEIRDAGSKRRAIWDQQGRDEDRERMRLETEAARKAAALKARIDSEAIVKAATAAKGSR